jgi:hypothetical protein
MRSVIIISLVIAGCFGCTNSNIYSRAAALPATAPEYLENDIDIHCSDTNEYTRECRT